MFNTDKCGVLFCLESRDYADRGGLFCANAYKPTNLHYCPVTGRYGCFHDVPVTNQGENKIAGANIGVNGYTYIYSRHRRSNIYPKQWLGFHTQYISKPLVTVTEWKYASILIQLWAVDSKADVWRLWRVKQTSYCTFCRILDLYQYRLATVSLDIILKRYMLSIPTASWHGPRGIFVSILSSV